MTLEVTAAGEQPAGVRKCGLCRDLELSRQRRNSGDKLRAMDAREPHDLLEVFYDQHKEPMVIIEELRVLAADQRLRWRHP